MAPLSSLFPLLSFVSAISALPTISLKRDLTLQKRGTYTEVFSGSGTDPGDTDASVSGWGYLTFTRLDTYDLTACESWCDGISACAFINLYYEYNTDTTYNPQIKCVAYAVPHTAADKTNWGGQQLLPPPAGVSYIQDSVGYTSDAFSSPPTPDGFSLVFGPIDDANEADGLLESHSLTFYDTQGCADLCNAIGSSCVYFNIWLGVDGGNPTYTCALYSIATDATTATNSGQGGIQVTNSRGYSRIPIPPLLLLDGDFEDWNSCVGCNTATSGPWTGDGVYTWITDDPSHSHSGNSFAVMTAPDHDGKVMTTSPLATVPGQLYQLAFWYQTGSTDPSEDNYEFSALIINWNADGAVWDIGYSTAGWVSMTVCVTGTGSDVLGIGGGYTYVGGGLIIHSYTYFDDISLTPLSSAETCGDITL